MPVNATTLEVRDAQKLNDYFAWIKKLGKRPARKIYGASISFDHGETWEIKALCPIQGKGFLFLPTPQASDHFAMKFSKESILKVLDKKRRSGIGQIRLPYILKLMDVPILEYRSIYEWLMKAPKDWTKF